MGRLGLGFGLGLGSEIRISASFQKIPRLVGGLCLGPRVVGWSGSGVWVSASFQKKTIGRGNPTKAALHKLYRLYWDYTLYGDYRLYGDYICGLMSIYGDYMTIWGSEPQFGVTLEVKYGTVGFPG